MSSYAPPGNCPLCGTYRERLQRDRVIPGFKGGTYTVDNIQHICANCHEDKSRKEASEASLAALARRKAAGLTVSDVTKAKQSASRLGKEPWNKSKKDTWNGKTPFYKGMPPTRTGSHLPGSIAKMRIAHAGKTISEETKAKMRLAQQARRQREKA